MARTGIGNEIWYKLITDGIGTNSSNWRVVQNELQSGGMTTTGSSWDTQIAVIPTGGLAPWVEEGSTHVMRPTFQVICRGSATASSGPIEKLDEVINALHLYRGTILGGYKIIDLRLQGEAAFLGRDEYDRPLWGANFVAWRSRTNAAGTTT